MKITRHCIIFILLWSFAPVKGQSYNKDSVLREVAAIRRLPASVQQAEKLRQLGHTLIEKDSALAGTLLHEALDKSLLLKDQDAVTNSHRLLGIYYSYFENYDKAMGQYCLSAQSADRNQNQYLKAGVLYNMANIKYWKSEYDSCIYYYTQSLRIFENPATKYDKNVTPKQTDRRLSDIYSNMSQVFNTLKNLEKANEYIDKAIAIDRKYDSEMAKQTLAFHMQQKADNYSENGETGKALHLRLKFLPRLESGGEIARIYVQQAYQNIAHEYFVLGKADSAGIYARKSLELATLLKMKSGIAGANRQLGEIALKNKQYPVAEAYFEKSKAYYSQTEDLAEQKSYYGAMHELKSALGKYKEAYEYFNRYKTASDSLLAGEKAEYFSTLETRYESEKKEAQIKLQQAQIKQKNIINYVFAGIALSLLVSGFLVYRNLKHRQTIQQQKINELETEKQLTATEAVLQGEEQERSRLAKDLHDGLGGMLSSVKYSFSHMKENLIMTSENAEAFERSIDMLDSSIKEMRRVAHNMMPEVLIKYGLDNALKELCADLGRNGSLQVNYQSIDMEAYDFAPNVSVTAYRVIQELTNNVLKHSGAQNLLVQAHVSLEDHLLQLTVEDDGKGLDLAGLENTGGIGWKNIRNRMELLKGKMDVNSGAGKGTSVLIEIPLV
jgi:two-component system NarL family sensor kinase